MPIIELNNNIIKSDEWPWGYEMPEVTIPCLGDDWDSASVGTYSASWCFPHEGFAGYKGPNGLLIAADNILSTWTAGCIGATGTDGHVANCSVSCSEGWRWPTITEYDAIGSAGIWFTVGLTTSHEFWTSVERSSTHAYIVFTYGGTFPLNSTGSDKSRTIRARCLRDPDI